MTNFKEFDLSRKIITIQILNILKSPFRIQLDYGTELLLRNQNLITLAIKKV